jgi:hypothetical protein
MVPPAEARTCGHVVMLTLPGVSWSDIARYRPPNLMKAIDDGAAGSMSVRTIDPRTSYSDAFATIGAGARMQGGATAGGVAKESSTSAQAQGVAPPVLGPPFRSVIAAGVPEIRRLALRAGYGARPGALGSALGAHALVLAAVGKDFKLVPPRATGPGDWTLLAAMDQEGRVPAAAVGDAMLEPAPEREFGIASNASRVRGAVERALAVPCSTVIVESGDLNLADLASAISGHRTSSLVRPALARTDALVGQIRARLNQRDLLLIFSPTSPAAWPATHLGVAIAVGPGFGPGAALESASTRRTGFVTLPDVAPTVLSFLHIPEPATMNGQRWYAVSERDQNRIAAAVATDDEAVFVDRLQAGISTGFVAFQVAVYLIALVLIARRERRASPASDRFRRGLEVVVLSVVAFPVSTYLAGGVETHRLGELWMVILLIAIDLALVAVVTLSLKNSLDRLLALTGFTVLVLMADLASGARLELSTVFGYSPIVAGRFAGIGNIGFAVLASCSVLTAALVVHRWKGSPAALIFAAALFGVTILFDGLPTLGSDVGGVIALVPALIVTWVLLAGKRPTLKLLLVVVGVLALALVVFLLFDLSRPPASQTHLARLFEEFRTRGSSALTDTLGRKIRANLKVFGSTVWTLSVPPALAVMAWLLLRPRGRWQLVVETYPRLRAGLVGALLVGILGFAANDSGIIIPAVVLSFFVPLAALLHLSLMDRVAA